MASALLGRQLCIEQCLCCDPMYVRRKCMRVGMWHINALKRTGRIRGQTEVENVCVGGGRGGLSDQAKKSIKIYSIHLVCMPL